MNAWLMGKAERAHKSGSKRANPDCVCPHLTSHHIYKLLLDTNVCIYCGAYMRHHHKQIDHIKPLSKKGNHSADNIRVICGSCNSIKGTMSHKEMRSLSNSSSFKRKFTSDADDLVGIEMSSRIERVIYGDRWSTWHPSDKPSLATSAGKELVWKGYSKQKHRTLKIK